jgi:hypothetical protein
MAIRFAIADDAAKFRSAAWRIWQNNKGDVYLLRRATGHLHKISLHQSRICRYAEESAGEPRKADIRWKRSQTPSSGLACAVCMIFPTSYLGKSPEPLAPEILRVPPASLGRATGIQVFFTHDDPQTVTLQLGSVSKLVSDTPMPNGELCGIACFNISDWQDVDVIVRASHHEGRELRFTAALPKGMERTFSLTLPSRSDIEGAPLMLVERYGYAVAPGTPFVQLTEPHFTLSRSEVRRVLAPAV